MQALPLPPPLPALMVSSKLSLARRVRSAIGPQAKSICRFFSRVAVHFAGSTVFGWLRHHTLSPLASASLNSRLLAGPSPRSAIRNS